MQVIWHTVKPDGLVTRADAIGPNLLPYVREQGIRNSKLPAVPPRIWLSFLATTGRRARFIAAHENHGEVLAERTDDRRFFDLRPTPVFAALADRLVIEWTKDAVNWAKTGDQAVGMTAAGEASPKDRSRLLVVELKRGRASDAVVGQIQRYMGYAQDALLEPDSPWRASSSPRWTTCGSAGPCP